MNGLYRWEQLLLERSGLQQLGRVIASQRNILCFAGLMLLLAYGYEIFNFSLRIDSEWYGAHYGAKPAWLAEGRWGMYFFSDWLLPDSVMPMVPALIAVLGLAVSGLLWLASMHKRTSLQAYFALAVIICCPIYYFVVYFTILGFGVGVAFALIGLANYLVFKKCWRWAWLIVVCYTVAMGTYQALLPVIAVMFGTVMLDHYINRQGDLRYLIATSMKFIGCFIVAALLSLWLAWLFAADVGREFAYIKSHNQLQLASLHSAIAASFNEVIKYYAGDAEYYLYPLPVLAVLSAVCLLLVAIHCLSALDGVVKKIIAIALLVLIVIAPMGLLIVGNGEMPPRAQVSIIWVLAGLIFLALGVQSLLLRAFLVLLLVPLIYKFIVIDNRYSFLAESQWQADKALSLLVLSEIQRQGLPAKPERGRYRLEVVGVPEFKQRPAFIKRESIGASLYVWDDGRAERIRYLYDSMGVDWFWAAKREDRKALIKHAETMPSWPLQGSINIVNDMILVKFSDYTQGQLLEICGSPHKCH